MILVIDGKGAATCLYDEAIDLGRLGPLDFHRASHVEPDVPGRWWADLQPAGGPVLGPFALRSEALTAERIWLEERLSALGAALPGPDDHGGPTASTQPNNRKDLVMRSGHVLIVILILIVLFALARLASC